MEISLFKNTLQFKQPARTSKMTYNQHSIWYVVIHSSNNPQIGVGECAPLPHISPDHGPEYEKNLLKAIEEVKILGELSKKNWAAFPSIYFGIESALRHFKMGDTLWESDFSKGRKGIPVNGLIWMSHYDHMLQQVEEKIALGFKCIKIKIGAMDFKEDLRLLSTIRRHYGKEKIELRVDANGAFKSSDAARNLEQLSALSIHSIEQPIAPNQWEIMRDLCKSQIVPVALDEELIGVYSYEEKERLLDQILPQYIVLKPTLHGGISGSEEWIRLADERDIGYWTTSALESNIGLNIIAQWSASLEIPLHQGLGTGMLYRNNTPSNLYFQKDNLFLKQPLSYKIEDFDVYAQIY